MTDTTTADETIEPPDDDPAPEGDESAVIRELRRKAAEADKAKAELEQIKRERAFDQAGVPADGPAKWFRQGYDGEVTAEAIRAAAEADGLLTPTGPDTDTVEQETTAAAEVSAVMGGGAPPAPTDLSDVIAEAGKAGFGSREELLARIAEHAPTDADLERIARQPWGT